MRNTTVYNLIQNEKDMIDDTSGFDTAIPEIKENTHTRTENNMVDDTKRKINIAVVRLIQNDPEFANNISKLADLCEDNPMIYKMAISKLENL